MATPSDSNASINQILLLLKHYRNQHNPNNSTQPSHFESFNPTQPSPSHDSSFELRLHASLDKLKSQPQQSSHANEGSDVYSRLHQEDRALRQRREQLFQQGRRSIEKKETKECTFAPNSARYHNRSMSQQGSDSFFKRNVDWQTKRQKEIKQKQMEKNSEGMRHFTFAPKVAPRKPVRRSNKENSQIEETRGSATQRTRAGKVRGLGDKQGSYSQMWQIKRGHFSHIH